MKKSESARIHSTLTKDINRIRKIAEMQIRMNILRKHQIKLLDKFLKELIIQGRISKEELRAYMPKKRETEKKLFLDKTDEKRTQIFNNITL